MMRKVLIRLLIALRLPQFATWCFGNCFLEEQSIGIIPPQGYRPKNKQSVKAMQWIKYHSQQTNIEIQHADNEGEKVIGPYNVDG